MAEESPKKSKLASLPEKKQIGQDYEINPPLPGAKIVAVSDRAGWAQDEDNHIYICRFPNDVPLEPVKIVWHPIAFARTVRIMAAAALSDARTERHALFVYDEEETCCLYSVQDDISNPRCQSALIPCNAVEEAEFVYTKTLAATMTPVDGTTLLASFNDSLSHYYIQFTEADNAEKDIKLIRELDKRYARPRARMTNIFDHNGVLCVAFFGADFYARRQTVCIYDFHNDRALYGEKFLTPVMPEGANVSPYVTAYAATRPGVGTAFILAPLNGLAFCTLSVENEMHLGGSVAKDTIGYIAAMTRDPHTTDDVCIMNVMGIGHWLNIYDDIMVQKGGRVKPKQKRVKYMPCRNLYKKYGVASMYNRDAESILKITDTKIVLHQSENLICLLTLDFDGDAPQ